MPPTQPPQPPASRRASRGPLLLAGLAAALPGTLTGIALNPDLASGGLLNPDSAMRMARLLDILEAGAPLHTVLRDNSGAGSLLHWSHLVDSLLLLGAAPLAPGLGWAAALQIVALLIGPGTLAGLGVALAWAVRPYAPAGWGWVAAAAAGAVPSVAGYGMTGVVHHHVLLAIAAVMTAGWALRLVPGAGPRPAGLAPGVALGAWAGAGLWLSPESLPFSIMAMGALWLAWLQTPDPRIARALAACGTGFAVVAALAWAVDPPLAGWGAVEPDRISLPFVLLAAVTMGLGLLACTALHRALVVTIGIAAATGWLLLFPQVLHGTEALLPREVVVAMFGGIQEMQPVRTLNEATETLLGGVFALGVLSVLAARRRSWLSVYAVGCAAGLVGLGALHVRFGTYAAVAGAALLPLAIRWASQARFAPPLQSALRLGLVMPLLLGPVLVPAAANADSGGNGAVCRASGAVGLLRAYPGRVVLSEVNVVPELLYRTRVWTVGSLFHRTPAGFMRLRAAWRSRPGAAPGAAPGATPGPEVTATGATLLLACPGAPRSALLQGLPHDTLLDRVDADLPPPWLHRLADAGPGGFVLYAVQP